MSNRQALVDVLLDRLNRPDTFALHADLRGVDFIDSSGIWALVVVRRAADDIGRSFLVVGAHGSVRRTLDIAGVLPVLSADTPSTGRADADRHTG